MLDSALKNDVKFNSLPFLDATAYIESGPTGTDAVHINLMTASIGIVSVRNVVGFKNDEIVDVSTPDADVMFVVTVSFHHDRKKEHGSGFDTIKMITDGVVWWQIVINPTDEKFTFIEHEYVLGREFQAAIQAAIEVFKKGIR